MKRRESLRDSYARKMREKMARGEYQPKPRKPLPKVSDKRKAENALYEKAKREWRKDHDGRCEMQLWNGSPTYRNVKFCRCPQKAMDQPHHLRKRLGGNLTDKSTFIGLCFEHHSWVHDNEKRARELGWLEA